MFGRLRVERYQQLLLCLRTDRLRQDLQVRTAAEREEQVLFGSQQRRMTWILGNAVSLANQEERRQDCCLDQLSISSTWLIASTANPKYVEAF
jgi:hypothetical protein